MLAVLKALGNVADAPEGKGRSNGSMPLGCFTRGSAFFFFYRTYISFLFLFLGACFIARKVNECAEAARGIYLSRRVFMDSRARSPHFLPLSFFKMIII